MQQWYFAEEFSGYDAALLIAGHNPAAHNQVGSSITREIIKRMEKNYNEACASYTFDRNGFYPKNSELGRAARRVELMSIGLERQMMIATFDDEEALKLAHWEYSDENSFHGQRFSRDELRRWLEENGLPHVYDFAGTTPQTAASMVTPAAVVSAAEQNKQVTPKSESAYLAIIGALCDVYWKLKHPDSTKIVVAELLRDLDSYRDYPGLGERNLKDKLPRAIRIVRVE